MNALNDLNPVTRWLDVAGSINYNINTVPSSVAFADVSCDSDFKLVVGDMGTVDSCPKLKIFKGTSLVNEIILPEIPTGVVSFFSNESLPRIPPVVAVSMCSGVYVYKNMKLFYKFYLPTMEVTPLELDIWRELSDAAMRNDDEYDSIVQKLNDISFAALASQSQQLLSLPPDKIGEFIKQHIDYPIQKLSIITCMTTLNMNSIEKDGVACLVLGTENGEIIILDPQTFTILHHARIDSSKSTPTHLAASGLYDVDYRIIIATREGTICTLKREWLEGKCLVRLSSLVVQLLLMPGDTSIIVATMDKTLHCYSKKGRKVWSVGVPRIIFTIALIELGHLSINLIAVAMTGGLIHFYNGKNLIDTISTQETVSVMKFGQLGQEENVLALITIDGALIIKILKRTAEFNTNTLGNSQKSHPSYIAAQQVRPLLVPKKSKLFLEQASRERDQSLDMHEIFQHELCQLRLYVAKTTLESIKNANNSLNIGSPQPLKLTARVEGLGPVFKIYLSIENLSPDKPVTNLSLLFITDNQYYKVFNPYILVPMIVPGLPYIFVSRVMEIFFLPDGSEDEENSKKDINTEPEVPAEKPPLKVVLVKDGNVQPLLAASIQIPPTDPLMMPFY